MITPAYPEETSESDGGEDFRLFTGNPGDGLIIFLESAVRVIPSPEAALREMNRGNWGRQGTKPFSADGEATVKLLLAQAYVVSKLSLLRCSNLRPCDDLETATADVRRDALLFNWSKELRRLALTHWFPLPNGWDDPKLVIQPQYFVTMFDALLTESKQAGDVIFDEFVRRVETLFEPYVDALFAAGSKDLIGAMAFPGLRPEPRGLLRAIASEAARHGRPPTKAEVRKTLQGHRFSALEEAGKSTNRFGELLAVIGFSWLPNGRAGRPRKSG